VIFHPEVCFSLWSGFLYYTRASFVPSLIGTAEGSIHSCVKGRLECSLLLARHIHTKSLQRCSLGRVRSMAASIPSFVFLFGAVQLAKRVRKCGIISSARTYATIPASSPSFLSGPQSTMIALFR
jgi:hypothetical protein